MPPPRPPVVVRPYPVPVPSGPGYTPAPTYTPAPAYTPPPAPAAPACPCADLGTFLRIVFQPNATTADMTALLKGFNLQMASGPDDAGAYRLLVSRAQVPPNQLNQLVEALRAQTTIVAEVGN